MYNVFLKPWGQARTRVRCRCHPARGLVPESRRARGGGGADPPEGGACVCRIRPARGLGETPRLLRHGLGWLVVVQFVVRWWNWSEIVGRGLLQYVTGGVLLWVAHR